MEDTHDKEMNEIGTLLLDIGAMLMTTGASTARIRVTINRISESFGYSADMFITHRALMLTINDDESEKFMSCLKRTAVHGVNFRIVSGISRMSWHVVEEGWTIAQIREELKRLSSLPHYPRLVTLCLVSLAGASFCRLFGGNYLEMLITFGASFVGLFVRQEMAKKKFNQYICIYCAAFTASLVAGFFMKIGLNIVAEHAFATSVLFLIPGIPLINTFSDLLDGNSLNGMLRCVHGTMIALAISLGVLTSILIYHF